jgi:hypothetical protein
MRTRSARLPAGDRAALGVGLVEPRDARWCRWRAPGRASGRRRRAPAARGGWRTRGCSRSAARRSRAGTARRRSCSALMSARRSVDKALALFAAGICMNLVFEAVHCCELRGRGVLHLGPFAFMESSGSSLTELSSRIWVGTIHVPAAFVFCTSCWDLRCLVDAVDQVHAEPLRRLGPVAHERLEVAVEVVDGLHARLERARQTLPPPGRGRRTGCRARRRWRPWRRTSRGSAPGGSSGSRSRPPSDAATILVAASGFGAELPLSDGPDV